MFEKKNILVTGGAGFVGTNLIKRLVESGCKNVRAVLHEKKQQYLNDKVDYVYLDLTKEGGCKKAVSDIDYIFHCAAVTSGAAVMEHRPLVHVTPNVIMNTQLLDAAYQAGIEKFIWMSSNTVYPVVNHAVKEDEMMPGNVFDKYFCVAWMKQFTEILCQMYSQKIKRKMTTVVVRPANIYGPYDDFKWETSHVLPALMRKVIERHDPIEVWGNGEDIKDFIYIDDFIEGLLLAAAKIDEFDPINIATGVPVTIKTALKTILESDGYSKADIRFNADKPTMIPIRLISPEKAKSAIGFTAKTSFKEGIKKTIHWYRLNNEVLV